MRWRMSCLACTVACFAATAGAQLLKPIDLNKRSDFEQQQFQSKGVDGRNYETGQYGKQGSYETKSFSTSEFSYSSKDFGSKRVRGSDRQVAAKVVPYKAFEARDKQTPVKDFEAKEMKTPGADARVADKPVTNWQTLIRKTPPTGVPGAPSGIPFSRWKDPDSEK